MLSHLKTDTKTFSIPEKDNPVEPFLIRYLSSENYVKRMEELEEVAGDFEGVAKCFAIQAGREVRIMVEPDSVDDVSATSLARDVVKNIEEKLAYPGQIKVVVIREKRSVEYAR